MSHFPVEPGRFGLLMIDFQRDFCAPGGYSDQCGGLEWVKPILPAARQLLDQARAAGVFIVHTREGYAPDLSDLDPHRLARSRAAGAEYGTQGPMGRLMIRGEHGQDIIDELQPLPGEIVIDKNAFGAFTRTNLERILRDAGVTKLAIAGVTADVCVHTTLREATDRGFDCFYVRDAISTFDPGIRKACERMVQQEGGIWGTLTTVSQIKKIWEKNFPLQESRRIDGKSNNPMPLFVERLTQTITALHSVGIVSRELHTEILRHALESHPEVFSVWSVWEPNAFDGRDEDYRNKPAHDATGRFIPSWHRKDGRLDLNPVTGYETQGRGDWYWIPKKTGELCGMDPYAVLIGGSVYWITSELAPILMAGKTMGVVGVDVLVEQPQMGGPNFRSTRLVPRSAPVVRVLSATDKHAGLLRLTKREREVHYWLCQGKSNEDIARILVVSPHTVKNHIDHIFQKLGVENRYAAALLHPSRTPQ